MARRYRVPVVNVARSWCGRFRRRGDGHNPRYCGACRRQRRAYWAIWGVGEKDPTLVRILREREARQQASASLVDECTFCLDLQIVYVGEHTEWLAGQGWVRTCWTLCRCRRLKLWEAGGVSNAEVRQGDVLVERHPFVRSHECRRCHETVQVEFVKAWQDHRGVRWARYRCKQGHEDYWTVTTQNYRELVEPERDPAQARLLESEVTE